jgi:hypothetical protein
MAMALGIVLAVKGAVEVLTGLILVALVVFVFGANS